MSEGGRQIAKGRRRIILIAALLIFIFALTFCASSRDSPTFDEPIYITSGYYYLREHNFTLNLEHPPLVKEVLAIPLAFTELKGSSPPIGFFQAQNAFAHRFLYSMGNDPHALLQASRLSAYIMLIILGMLIYLWGRRIYGHSAGIFALAFYAFTPVFLGDGRLAILDLGATLFIYATLYSFYLFLEEPGTRKMLVCVLLFAAAQLSRFNALVLVPLMILLALLKPFFRRFTPGYFSGSGKKFSGPVGGWPVDSEGEGGQQVNEGERTAVDPGPPFTRRKRGSGGKRRTSWRGYARESGKLLWRTIAIILAGMVLVMAFYGIHTAGLDRCTQENNIKANLQPDSSFTGPLIRINRFSPPLAHYLLGLAHTYEYMKVDRISYWNGYFSRRWRWYYYPFILMVKTPIPLLLLILAGLITSLRNWRRWEVFFILVTLAVLAGASEASTIQLGIRYIMPVVPFLLLLAGLGGARMARWVSNRGLRWALMASLLLWTAVSVLSFYPSFLSYSNEFIWNKNESFKWLVDSNLDWGQDLRRLAAYVEENDIQGLKIDYFGGGEPGYYIKDAVPWYPDMGTPRGWFAVSYTYRQLEFWEQEDGKRIEEASKYAWLLGYQPVARIGYSILLYYIP